MKNQTEVLTLVRAQSPGPWLSRVSSPVLRATFQLVLVFVAAVILVGCAGGPPTPPPPPDPAEAKAEAKAREEFARDLPKPRER